MSKTPLSVENRQLTGSGYLVPHIIVSEVLLRIRMRNAVAVNGQCNENTKKLRCELTLRLFGSRGPVGWFNYPFSFLRSFCLP